jgi:hypothetical protein
VRRGTGWIENVHSGEGWGGGEESGQIFLIHFNASSPVSPLVPC